MLEAFCLSVVVPCLDEEANVAALYAEIAAELGSYDDLEVLFVDDGSTDGTLAAIRELAEIDPRVSFVSFTRNFGLEAAFSAGYRYARNDWILHLDADLQFPPREGHALIATARQGYDAVFGVRVDRQDSRVRRFSSRAHDFIARRVLGIELPQGATTFRLVRACLARRVVDLELGTPYFLATLPKLTSAWTTVPTAHRARVHGTSKVHFRGLARHAFELFFSFSSRLITCACLLALLGAVVAVCGGVLAAFGAPVRAWSTAVCIALASGLAASAIATRYLVHVGRGQARPPQYLIRDTNVDVADKDLLVPRRVPSAL